MSHRVYMYPAWIRLWHWTNAVLIIGLTASGVSLHYSNPAVGLIDFNLAREVHNACGIALCGAYAVFFVGNIVTGNWWQFVPQPHRYLWRAWLQMRFYSWDIFFGRPHPFPPTLENNFNPLQQVFYWAVMYLLMPTLLVTGLIFLYPELAPESVMGFDGLLPVAMAHYMVGFLIVCFMVMHIYLGTTGHRVTTLFKAMATGWHEE
jgi:thiosulfate reductase cytochrome b subunit